ncbi:MAG: endopeptidase La [Anaerolineales bacterium]|nr:endopeptidase La [Anaerolineales bacterium]
MTATKWTDAETAAIFPQLEEIIVSLPDLSLLPIDVNKGGESESVEAQAAAEAQPAIPDTLAILPLRGVVVYPLTAVPLTVGQPRSVKLVDDAAVGQRIIGLVASANPELETPGSADLYRVGTAAVVHRLFRAPDGTIRLLVQGLARFRLVEFIQEEPYLKARIELAPEVTETSLEVEALMRNLSDQFQKLGELVPSMPAELLTAALSVEDPRQFVYTVATYQRMELADAQRLLELDSVVEKMRQLLGLLNKEVEVLELGRKIQTEAQSEMEKVQRDYFLREQMKAIQRELGEADEQAVEVEAFRAKIAETGMPEEAAREAARELDRLARLPTAAAEYGVIRTYLDWLTSLPWNALTSDNLDVTHARQVLDQDHYDLEDVKERILEYLAVRKLRAERRDEAPPAETARTVDYIRSEREGAILCFVGPPGVGKTSLGQSIARALGRKFIRMSLGGIRDEAEIRGHRRTYIGALPGRIMQALRRAGTKNPVFMLDEIDKLGMDFRGDPASALLEVLDPEQNREFRDHYLDVPFDLSQVMFITTANQLETVPGPLRDRMEILQLSGYTEGEKLNIARNYLIPRQIKENGLRPGEIEFTEAALRTIIRNHTREAGVRSLERQIGAVCRKIVTRIAEGKTGKVVVDRPQVTEYLGKPEYFYTEEVEERTAVPGVATALAYTPVGGDIMFVEATQMPGSKGFQLTGQLGEVMQESARAALSYVRANAKALGLPDDYFTQRDIHLHVPAGATPKDGPSAGVTMATALVSLVTGRPVRADVGMTGEITLRGQVLPIGGLKEKVLAAHRAGLKTVIIPKRNENDLDDVPAEVREQINFVLADRMDDVLRAALEQPRDDGRGSRASGKNGDRGAAKAPRAPKARPAAKRS